MRFRNICDEWPDDGLYKKRFICFYDKIVHDEANGKICNLDWSMSEEEFEEADSLVEKFEDKGYKISNKGPIDSLIAKTPSGNLLSRNDIEKILLSGLEVGNKEQIEALKAAEYLKSFHAYMYQRGAGEADEEEIYGFNTVF